ncbi:uncharacterized protein EAF02_001505 [Botrytis sinoallii]|uniref:uncharacterized protein n=1 Tax=Botrytis sinoallii TaxID=1463999 RepID=UPI001901C03F|nr:uncharacterized protein EAF02_001505 [Botrytis sinoallii]KAF7891180.1 hypothetical protein EAF02_001505 [Botrytis sinoallii]
MRPTSLPKCLLQVAACGIALIPFAHAVPATVYSTVTRYRISVVPQYTTYTDVSFSILTYTAPPSIHTEYVTATEVKRRTTTIFDGTTTVIEPAQTVFASECASTTQSSSAAPSSDIPSSSTVSSEFTSSSGFTIPPVNNANSGSSFTSEVLSTSVPQVTSEPPVTTTEPAVTEVVSTEEPGVTTLPPSEPTRVSSGDTPAGTYNAVDCYSDEEGTGFPLAPPVTESTDPNVYDTVGHCLEFCSTANGGNPFRYAAIGPGHCYCSNGKLEAEPATDCSYPCPGDSTQVCGGSLPPTRRLRRRAPGDAIIVYELAGYVPPTSIVSTNVGPTEISGPSSTSEIIATEEPGITSTEILPTETLGASSTTDIIVTEEPGVSSTEIVPTETLGATSATEIIVTEEPGATSTSEINTEGPGLTSTTEAGSTEGPGFTSTTEAVNTEEPGVTSTSEGIVSTSEPGATTTSEVVNTEEPGATSTSEIVNTEQPEATSTSAVVSTGEPGATTTTEVVNTEESGASSTEAASSTGTGIPPVNNVGSGTMTTITTTDVIESTTEVLTEPGATTTSEGEETGASTTSGVVNTEEPTAITTSEGVISTEQPGVTTTSEVINTEEPAETSTSSPEETVAITTSEIINTEEPGATTTPSPEETVAITTSEVVNTEEPGVTTTSGAVISTEEPAVITSSEIVNTKGPSITTTSSPEETEIVSTEGPGVTTTSEVVNTAEPQATSTTSPEETGPATSTTEIINTEEPGATSTTSPEETGPATTTSGAMVTEEPGVSTTSDVPEGTSTGTGIPPVNNVGSGTMTTTTTTEAPESTTEVGLTTEIEVTTTAPLSTSEQGVSSTSSSPSSTSIAPPSYSYVCASIPSLFNVVIDEPGKPKQWLSQLNYPDSGTVEGTWGYDTLPPVSSRSLAASFNIGFGNAFQAKRRSDNAPISGAVRLTALGSPLQLFTADHISDSMRVFTASIGADCSLGLDIPNTGDNILAICSGVFTILTPAKQVQRGDACTQVRAFAVAVNGPSSTLSTAIASPTGSSTGLIGTEVSETGASSTPLIATTIPSETSGLVTSTSTFSPITSSTSIAGCPVAPFFRILVNQTGMPAQYLWDPVSFGDDALSFTTDAAQSLTFSLSPTTGQLQFNIIDFFGNPVLLASNQDTHNAGNEAIFFSTATKYQQLGYQPVVASIKPDCSIGLTLPYNAANIIQACHGSIYLMLSPGAGCVTVSLLMLPFDPSATTTAVTSTTSFLV